MRGLALDLRFAWRQLAGKPLYAFTAIATIAFAVGGVSAIASLVDGVLLRPLPVPHAERIVAVHRAGSDEADISQPDAIDLRAGLRQFDAFAIVAAGWSLDLTGGSTPVRLRALLTEAPYFEVVSTPALLGRVLRTADDRAGAEPVVVLSERAWRSRWAADPGILGRVLNLSGVAATVVGVAPDAADVLDANPDAYVSTPAFAPWALASRGSNNFEAIARVAGDASPDAARAELSALSSRLPSALDAAQGAGKVLDFTPLVAQITAPFRSGLWMLAAAVALVLLLAAVNVAALTLVRFAGRGRELRVRHALGAPRRRLARQLLTEGALLAAIGGAIGLLLAVALVELLRATAPADLPRIASVTVDARSFLVAFAASALCALLTACAPLLSLRRIAAPSTRNAALGSNRRLSLGLYVALEVALAVVLMVGTLLLLRSFAALTRVDLGFEPSGVVSADLVLPESRYAEPAAQTLAVQRIVAALQTTPGVRAAAFVVDAPLSNGGIGHGVMLEGVADADRGARFRPSHGDYARAMGLRLLAGRLLSADDERNGAQRVAVVNRRFAERNFGSLDVVGRRISWNPGEAWDQAEGPHWMTIVGVVEDVRARTLRGGDEATVYAPYVQRDDPWIRFGSLVARVDGDPAAYAAALQAAVSAADPDVPIENAVAMSETISRALARDRFNLGLIALFGCIALLLGLQGIHGVVAFALEQRRAELGLRMALGASPARAAALLWREGLAQAGAGAAVGAALAMALGSALSGVLFGVTARDPLALIGAIALVLSSAALAVWTPARRVGRLDPAIALRSE